MTGKVFNIQRFSLHDGPGIRTTLFLMGCSLRCRWCHNPEGLQGEILLQYNEKECVGCQACRKVCPNGVHQFDEQKVHILAFENCALCGKCMEVCPAQALTKSGKVYAAQELAELAVRDRFAYKNNGGVTFSGGEPLLQADFVAETAKICRELGTPTIAVDTAGNVPWENFEKVLPWTDYFLFDIKAGSEEAHLKGTGYSNRLILENLKRLDETGKPIYIRIPVICGINDSEEEIKKIAVIAAEISHAVEARLLPYHTFGREKYLTLGYGEAELFAAPDEEQMTKLRQIISSAQGKKPAV